MIGIFDSGIGGLTVANAIQEAMPNVSMTYFGDTAHLPYGDKSPELIRHYAARIAHFLIEQGAEIIVIACNTASAQAAQTVRDVAGPSIPVVNVIDPVARAVAARHPNEKVGVIGTKGTIRSRVYARRIRQLSPGTEVASLATPLLVPMIEEGFYKNEISRALIQSYLEKPVLKDISALILGCTHYPLIRKEVSDYYEGKVEILDSPTLVVKEVEAVVNALDLDRSKPGSYHFMVSDYTNAFERSTRIFFKQRVSLKEERLWD
jgi:glutamate racemase